MRAAPPLLALAALLCAGCGKKVCDDFPAALGFEPLESIPSPPDGPDWPPGTLADPYPETICAVPASSPGRTSCNVWYGPALGHGYAWGRAWVKAPLAKVYAALQDPAASRIHTPGDLWAYTLGVEPQFPISFQIHYTVHDTATVEWDILHRGGVLQASPQRIGLRYQKTCGTSYIAVESGSLVAWEAPDPNVTQLEMVGWLAAATQGPPDVGGTLTDLYGNLLAMLAAMPP